MTKNNLLINALINLFNDPISILQLVMFNKALNMLGQWAVQAFWYVANYVIKKCNRMYTVCVYVNVHYYYVTLFTGLKPSLPAQ